MLIFIILCFIASGFALYAMKKNNETYKQKIKMIDWAYKQKDFFSVSAQIMSVNYNKHFESLLFRRDPLNLYPQDLVARFKETATIH